MKKTTVRTQKRIALIALLFAAAAAVSVWSKSKGVTMVPNVVLLNSTDQESFDPLNADFANNRLAMRLLYSTPLEVSNKSQLVSSILEAFNYDENKRTIYFEIKGGATFSDGTALTIEDVKLSILRLALRRPYFPVVKNIEGLAAWLELKSPLSQNPSGIRESKNSLAITLDRNVKNALFRLTLEVFSVIPRASINIADATLNTTKPPFSGKYILVNQNKESALFARRDSVAGYGDFTPDKIRLSHMAAGRENDALKLIDDHTIVSGWESSLEGPVKEQLDKFQVRWLPRSWFTSMILNPRVKPFDDINCRRLFASLVRKKMTEILHLQDTEGSQFTAILPGYLSIEELGDGLPDFDEIGCRAKLRKIPIIWATVGEGSTPFRRAVAETLKELGQKNSNPIYESNYDRVLGSFNADYTSILGYSSGFWAQDAVGDLQMYFTPGLHPVLKFVTQDSRLRTLLSSLDDATDKDLVGKLEEINRYLYERAESNIVAHARRFYLSKNPDLIAEPAFSLSSPAPWQLFKADQ